MKFYSNIYGIATQLIRFINLYKLIRRTTAHITGGFCEYSARRHVNGTLTKALTKTESEADKEEMLNLEYPDFFEANRT